MHNHHNIKFTFGIFVYTVKCKDEMFGKILGIQISRGKSKKHVGKMNHD